MTVVKQAPAGDEFEPLDDYRSLQQEPEADIPNSFEREEWEDLTGVIITALYHSIS
jgi:hypothetical protein